MMYTKKYFFTGFTCEHIYMLQNVKVAGNSIKKSTRRRNISIPSKTKGHMRMKNQKNTFVSEVVLSVVGAASMSMMLKRQQ